MCAACRWRGSFGLSAVCVTLRTGSNACTTGFKLQQFRNGTKVGIVEALVGAHGETVGEPGGEVAEAAMAPRGGRLLLDQFLYLQGQNT